MNDQNRYDQLLRDKLSRLQVPDAEKTWPGMRMLLDEEMPEGGRSRRRGGWWFYTAVLIFIIAGSWTLMTFNFSKQNVDPPLSSAKNTSPPGAAEAGQKKAAEIELVSEKPDVADDKILLNKKVSNNKEVLNNNEVSNNKDQSKSNQKATLPLRANSLPTGNKNAGTTAGVATATAEVGKVDKTDGSVIAGPLAASNRRGHKPGNKSTSQTDPSATVARQTKQAPGLSTSITSATGIPNKYQDNSDQDNGAVAEQAIESAKIVPIDKMVPASYAEGVDSLNTNPASYITYSRVSRKYYRQNKKYGKPVNIREPYTTDGRNFAIGLSLPLGFPLGDQKALGYNVNAGPNTASDYIPAPHAQYHFHSKAYLQSELQVMSPQFIKPALLYQTKTANNFYQTTSSVSAEKLYYFNVPLSLHYSPFKHFYMGTGLQFSSLLSGVAMHEQQSSGMVPSDSVYIVSYSKFSNDSISDKLSGSEMRLMLDANYYWNKFTVGLRYNQALSNYVSTRAAPGVPLTVDKNKSLQFYMRYNLWEDKKRKTSNTRPLASR